MLEQEIGPTVDQIRLSTWHAQSSPGDSMQKTEHQKLGYLGTKPLPNTSHLC